MLNTAANPVHMDRRRHGADRSLSAIARPSSWPRETRDTLFLLAVVAWIVLPQVTRLPWWCSALTGAILITRAVLAFSGRPLPGTPWLMALLAIAAGATFGSYRTLLGREAGVTLVVVLLALKTLELRARRDAFVVFFLGFFTMLTNFFHSQSLLTAAGMVIGLIGLLTALVNAHTPVGRPPLVQSLRTAGWMALLGAPVMAVLFMLFPRMAPLWGIPADGLTGRSGLSQTMEIGHIASLVLDSSIAMRVRFDGPIPPQNELYFRGPVLGAFDGRSWQPVRPRFGPRTADEAQLEVEGPPVRYELTLEPHNRTWLLALDAAARPPTAGPGRATMSAELSWSLDRPVTDTLRYRAESHPRFQHGRNLRLAQVTDYLALPEGTNPRTVALAREMRTDPAIAAGGPPARVRAALERLRGGGYRYTLEPGPTGEHSADTFWFDTKEGFCEHIASAFVVLLRAMDVPARVVTGYQGGERNPFDDYWIIRQSDAHAWTEVWLSGQGWVRVDPTGAVAPGRVGAQQRLLPRPGPLAEAVAAFSPTLTQQLRALWEATNNRWNQWILNYTQSRQLDLLKNLGFESPDWHDLAQMLIGIVVAAASLGALWTLWERRQRDPWLRLHDAVRRRLARVGLDLPASAPPREMARRLEREAEPSPAREGLRAWLLELEAWRYAPPDERRPHTLRDLRRRLHELDKERPWLTLSPQDRRA